MAGISHIAEMITGDNPPISASRFLIPNIITATGLPLVPVLPEVCKALDGFGSAVLRADPGSGKSTLVPPALLDHFGGRLVMLEPRRASVLGIASRLAELLGEKVGERVGYAVRLERKVSSRTQIEVVTEGLLVRRMQENPSMFDGDRWTVIFDEFHERSVHTDLALALVLDLKRIGAKIRLLVMSATMDADKTAACIDNADTAGTDASRPAAKTTVIECPGRVFSVETSYRPLPQKAPLDREWAAALAGILHEENNRRETHTPPLGDILVFLPGRREIAACAGYAKDCGLDDHFNITILHGSLPLVQQRKIILPDQNRAASPGRRQKRRVVLATNIAETGLTIPGIELVVDTGYARILRFYIPGGMNRLSLERISGNSAGQRAGRAGRLGPGRCIRLWAENEILPDETPPEIARIDLSAAVLECLLWGVKTPADLPWPQPPPESAWRYALELLEELGAVSDGQPTETGRQIARLGLEPRLGRLCIAGKNTNFAGLACITAAVLSERNDSGLDDDPDFQNRLSGLRLGNGESYFNRIIESATDLAQRLGISPLPEWSIEDEANIGELLITAFPDRVAKKSGEGLFRFPSGREARINPAFPNTEWLCALETDSGDRRGFIRLAVPLSEETALAVLERRTIIEKAVEWDGLVPHLLETKKAGRILLNEKKGSCPRCELLRSLSLMLEEKGLSVLPWDDNNGSPRRLLARIRYFVNNRNNNINKTNDVNPGNSSDNSILSFWNDETLVKDAAEWLGPFVWNGAESGKGEIVDADGLCNALANHLGYQEKQEMDRSVPDHFLTPSGRKRPVDYNSGEPVVRIRIQDAFGITGNCQILGRSIVFHLLSPADRPVQITCDIDGFWAGSYTDVRKDMRGRYPKHHWPEDPLVGGD